MDSSDENEEYNLSLFIDLDIEMTDLDKLHKLNTELKKFKNGLLIFDLVGFETYPIIYRKKFISSYDLPDLINDINDRLKNLDLKYNNIKSVDSYLLLNNILIFKLIGEKLIL